MVKNAKTKLRRIKNKYGIDLSDEIKIPKLEEFSTRKEFNEFKEKIRSFTNRNNLNYQFVKNKYGVVANKKQINEIIRNTKKAQKLAKEQIKEVENLPTVAGGKKQKATVGQKMLQMGRPNAGGINIPKDFNFDTIQTKRELLRKEKNMREKAYPEYYDWRKEQMKMNFMKMLELAYNSDANDVVEKISKIPPDDFYEMYLMFEEFDFNNYDSEGQSIINEDNNLRRLESYVNAYYEGKVDLDLKAF